LRLNSQSITRRRAIRLLGSASTAVWLAGKQALNLSFVATASAQPARSDRTPPLAPGAPTSPERMALVDAFRKNSEGLQNKFEARSFKSDFVMPYRLLHPEATGLRETGSEKAKKVPLVVYLHGRGGMGDDNLRQLQFGNIFGTRVWLLPENQKRFPCYVVAPQTDRGWIKYDLSQEPAKEIPGLGDGDRVALEIVDAVRREFPIDDRRIYVAGNSMGGGGVWNMLASRPHFFAAAVACVAVPSSDDPAASIETPLWSFHGDSDQIVPVETSRDRIAARRKAGGHPLYTEYAGVDHDAATGLAFTEPELVKWVFAQRRHG
jgi:predicted peptidase